MNVGKSVDASAYVGTFNNRMPFAGDQQSDLASKTKIYYSFLWLNMYLFFGLRWIKIISIKLFSYY